MLWGYCHVPAFSSVDMTAAIEAQKADRPTLRGSSVARSIVSSRPGAPRVVVVERRRARI